MARFCPFVCRNVHSHRGLDRTAKLRRRSRVVCSEVMLDGCSEPGGIAPHLPPWRWSPPSSSPPSPHVPDRCCTPKRTRPARSRLATAASRCNAAGLEEVGTVTVTYVTRFHASQGTKRTALRMLQSSGFAWVDGEWIEEAPARRMTFVDLPDPVGRVAAVSFPSAEVISIPSHVPAREVRVYLAVPRIAARVLSSTGAALTGMARSPLGGLVARFLGDGTEGPDEATRRRDTFHVAVDVDGTRRGKPARQRVIVRGRDPYGLTAAIARQGALLLSAGGRRAAGVLAPAAAFDAKKFLDGLQSEGVSLRGAAGLKRQRRDVSNATRGARRQPALDGAGARRHGRTSQPLASFAGAETLRGGGNAVDAAVVRGRRARRSSSRSAPDVGGDCFDARVERRRGEALRAERQRAGAAGARRSEACVARGLAAMPMHGIVAGHRSRRRRRLVRRRSRASGTRSLAEVLAPADRVRGGRLSGERGDRGGVGVRRGAAAEREGGRVLRVGGARAPRSARSSACPDLARSLRAVAAGGADAFYRGELAERDRRLREARRRLRSTPTISPRTARPGSSRSRPSTAAYICHEMPPNGQGLAALVALNILECFACRAIPHDAAPRCICGSRRSSSPTPTANATSPTRSRSAFRSPSCSRRTTRRGAPSSSSRTRARKRGARALPRTANRLPHHRRRARQRRLAASTACTCRSGPAWSSPGRASRCTTAASASRSMPRTATALAPGKRPFHTSFRRCCARTACRWSRSASWAATCRRRPTCNSSPIWSISAATSRKRSTGRASTTSTPIASRWSATSRAARRERAAPHADTSIEDELAAIPRGGFGGGQAIAIDRRPARYWGGSDCRKDGCAIGF